MAKIDFGGTVEDVVTRDELPLEKAREVLSGLGLWGTRPGPGSKHEGQRH